MFFHICNRVELEFSQVIFRIVNALASLLIEMSLFSISRSNIWIQKKYATFDNTCFVRNACTVCKIQCMISPWRCDIYELGLCIS